MQVRVLCEAAGLEVLSLKRVRIGGFRLPADLQIGAYRYAVLNTSRSYRL
jgi:16S rRNA U516 pseudouridylate synthase RsuA-like enzyme